MSRRTSFRPSTPGPTANRSPGPLLRARAGDLLRVTVDNQLPVETSVHWHGLAQRNDMDGVPHLTQDPIPAGESFGYEFTAPTPGTYFYHPHSGVHAATTWRSAESWRPTGGPSTGNRSRTPLRYR